MGRVGVFLSGLLFSLVMMFPILACGQTASNPRFPDFNSWQKVSSDVYPALVDGKDAQLLMEVYSDTDLVNLRRGMVEVIYNDANRLWFAVYMEEVGEKRPDGTVHTKESHTYLFESVSGKWAFALDISDIKSLDEFNDLLKSRYGLEFKK